LHVNGVVTPSLSSDGIAGSGHDQVVEVPPAVVVDAHDVCPNLEQAQDALRETLGNSVAPQEGWRLRVFDERRGTHVIVTANLDDAQGNAVAHREIDATSSDRCAGVISALGVWAALVLDAEVTKAKAHPPTNPSTPPGGDKLIAIVAHDAVVADAGVPQPHGRTLEIGASGTLMSSPLETSGTTDAALVGVGGDIFMLVELARSFFVRPSLAAAALVGGSTPATYYATRVDACLRIPGNYVEHRGLLLDACAGTELGALDHGSGATHTTDAVFSLGPTIGLRGELASDLSVEVRGLAGFNVAHTGDQIALLAVRAELGFTWRLR
jgi:hypothetical protein